MVRCLEPPNSVALTFDEQSLRSILIGEGADHGRTFWYAGRDPRRALVSDAHVMGGTQLAYAQQHLRCLYTDAPSSLQQAYSRHSQSSFSSYSPSNFAQGNAPYPPATHGHNGRLSLPGAYGGQSPVSPYPGQPSTPHGRAGGREEIILVSDDRVLTLRMAALPGQ